MLLQKEGDAFVALTRYEEKDLPKKAGFKWDVLKRHWYTKDVHIAAKLYGYADSSCRAELEALSTQYDTTIEASKSRGCNISVPTPEGKEFRPFQLAGIDFLLKHKHALLADDMGLGKTPQTIGVINYCPEIKSVLIICPNSLKINWRNELNDWLTRKLSVGIGAKSFPADDIVIINYDILKKFATDVRKRHWDLVIVDESHFCKNPKAQRTTQVVGKKARNVWILDPLRADRMIALTGTPILNRTIELFPILNWLDPANYDNFFKFGLRYAAGKKGRFGWDFTGHSNLKELQQKLRSTVMIRRTKAEVLTDLPPKIRQVIEIPAQDETLAGILKERQFYENCMENISQLRAAAELAKLSDNQQDYHNAISRLKDSQAIAFKEMAKVRHDTAILKLPILANHLREMLEGTDKKIVVFAHHHDMINGLYEQFPGMCVRLTGEQDVDEKNDAVVKFVEDPNCRVFLGSIKAAGIGLNKLQLVCSHAVFAEEDWVPAWITQCEDRLHRYGQLSSVLCQHYVLEGSIDSMMAKRTVTKQNVADKALDKGLAVGQALKLEELSANYAEPVATESVSPDQLTLDSQKLTSRQIDDIHLALKMIAGLCDGARAVDGIGFNKFDTRLGVNLAQQGRLTPKAAALGRKIVLKYKKQLPEEAISSFKEL
jgi:SWI/SNF-related matrix-associated actin-dependent regulator 1 of chromatin subfamily A